MTTKDGGPVFPQPLRPADPDAPDDEQGMSLRDYFASQAMAALGAHKAVQNAERGIAWLANHAYLIADAMLAEREK